MEEPFGHPLTNERQYIILIFLIYLYSKTKDILLRYCFLSLIGIHLYKLYKNYSLNNTLYENYKKYILIYNILLLVALIVFLIKGIYLPFIILFVITRYLIRDLNKDQYTYIDIINNSDIFVIFISCILYIYYPKYKYRYIFITEIINHAIEMYVHFVI